MNMRELLSKIDKSDSFSRKSGEFYIHYTKLAEFCGVDTGAISSLLNFIWVNVNDIRDAADYIYYMESDSNEQICDFSEWLSGNPLLNVVDYTPLAPSLENTKNASKKNRVLEVLSEKTLSLLNDTDVNLKFKQLDKKPTSSAIETAYYEGSCLISVTHLFEDAFSWTTEEEVDDGSAFFLTGCELKVDIGEFKAGEKFDFISFDFNTSLLLLNRDEWDSESGMGRVMVKASIQ